MEDWTKKPLVNEERKSAVDPLERFISSNNQNKNEHEKVVAKELFNDKNIKQKTRLDVDEITLVNRGEWLADFAESKGYKEYANRIRSYYGGVLNLRPSLNGLSRAEFTKIFREEIDKLMQEKAVSLVQK